MPVKYESGAVEKVEEDLCAGVNQNMVLGKTRPSFGPATFEEMRSHCLAEGKLFVDSVFKADNSSLNLKEQPHPVEWKRPSEISPNPQFFVEEQSRFDVNQGHLLGDCWLLAAIANLTQHKNLFSQVVPSDQSFSKDYAGIFHFRFWRNGRRVDVVIDDLLPTYQGRLVFQRSSETNEFWSALLEKAYAKLYGSYGALHGGWPGRAMETFTGGVAESYRRNQFTKRFYNFLLQSYERKSLIAAVIGQQSHWHKAMGLPGGHAYSVTGVKLLDIRTPRGAVRIPLLRIRNPWGTSMEWKGPWSDRSQEWRYIPQSEREELGLTVDDDGEFWMSYEDFVEYFHGVEICHWNSDALGPEECPEGCSKKWETSVFEGEWVRGVTASGCGNHMENFSRSPQYTVTLTDPDEDDDENKCTLIVALTEKSRPQAALTTHAIGFSVYKLPDNKPVSLPVDVNSFNDDECVGRCHDLTPSRNATARLELEPGTYVIVPSTGEDQEGEFLLRVFSEKAYNMAEHGRDMRDVGDRVHKEVVYTETVDTVTVLE